MKIRYFGWSSFAVETPAGTVFFDPFYRQYCGVKWFDASDFAGARYVCVTHGHEEHFLDVPEVLRQTNAIAIGPPSVCRFLRRRSGIPDEQLRPLDPAAFEAIELGSLRITAFPRKHRDINLMKAITKALLKGNTTQLKWAWSSATNAPFYAPFTGFHVELPRGPSILNYNEGFNSKMTDAEITDIARRFKVDVLIAGAQLGFVDDVVRGVRTLAPKVAILYPPHEKLFAMMGVTSEAPEFFAAAVRKNCPNTEVLVAAPGFTYETRLLQTPELQVTA